MAALPITSRPTRYVAAAGPADEVQHGSGISPRVLDLLRGAISEANKAPGRHLITFVGETGVGKSTAVNNFAGLPMDRVDEETIAVRPPHKAIAEIGSSPTRSCTLYTKIYETHPIPGTDPALVIADGGGGLDTRGPEERMAVVSSLKLTLENAASVRLIFCYDSNEIKKSRSNHFFVALGEVLDGLVNFRNPECHDAIMCMFMKPRTYVDRYAESPVPYTRADLIRELRKIEEDLDPGSDLQEMLAFVLRDKFPGIVDGEGGSLPSPYVTLYDPIVGPNEIIPVLTQMRGLQEGRGFFRTRYSAEARMQLTNTMTEIALRGIAQFDKWKKNRADKVQLSREIDELKTRIEDCERIFCDRTGHETIDDAEVYIEMIRKEQRKAIRAEQRKLKECDREIRENEDAAKEMFRRLEEQNEKGEEDVEVWSLQETVSYKKSAEFRFPGIPGVHISKVVHYPLESPYWKNKQPKDPIGKTTYSVTFEYDNGDSRANPYSFAKEVFGKSLKPEVYIYSKSADTVVHSSAVRQIQCKGMELERRGDGYLERKREIEARIRELESLEASEGTREEWVDYFRKNIEGLESEKKEKESKLERRRSYERKILREIERNRGDFDFLKDYVHLSQDEELVTRRYIQDFFVKRDEIAKKQIRDEGSAALETSSNEGTL